MGHQYLARILQYVLCIPACPAKGVECRDAKMVRLSLLGTTGVISCLMDSFRPSSHTNSLPFSVTNRFCLPESVVLSVVQSVFLYRIVVIDLLVRVS